VTIIGPGGIGKTWLAVELGWRLAPEFPDGVYLIDLAPVKEAAALASAIAQPLGIALRSTDTPSRIIGCSIDKRKLLLILDGCEYVTEDARVMTEALLAQAPNLSVLATSQVALRVPKEVLFRLAPLGPEESAALFVETVRAIDHGFEASGENAAFVAEICRRLDGLPLAIEMAADAVPLYGIEEVLAGLVDRFTMLDAAPRPGAERHATLSAVMEWSHGLLEPSDRETFRRLARFAGSFTAAAAGAIVWPGGASKYQAPAALARLVNKSLLVQQNGKPPRYRMLETIAMYAAAQLDASGERDLIAERHALYYTRLFEQADLAWETMPDAEWLALHGPEIGDARAALDWALEQPERRDLAIALGGAVAYLWERLDLSAEGRGYLDRLVALIDETVPTAEAARVLRSAGMLWQRTDRARSVALTERSVALYRQMQSGPKLGAALGFLGSDYVFLGRHAEAKSLLEEAYGLLTEREHAKSLFRATSNLGTLAEIEGRAANALEYFTAARDLARNLKDGLRANIVINNLGVLDFSIGNLERAIEHFREAVSGFISFGRTVYLGYSLVNLAACLGLRDELAEARGHATEALALLRAAGGRWLTICLQLWAFLGSRAGRYAEAAQLLGFVDAAYARSGEIRQPISQRVYDELSSVLAAHCTTDNIGAWADDGERWSEPHAVDFATRRIISAQT
jgi:predicted ATPase